MELNIGPESLPQFEDRLLYHLVTLTGDRPMGVGEGISEAELAVPLAAELNITPEFAQSPAFHHSDARGIILAGVDALDHEGLVEALRVMGPGSIRPTRDGRRRVGEWRKTWEQNQVKLDRTVQRRILEELDRQRRANPERHNLNAKIDVDTLCADLEIEKNVYLANAKRLKDQRKIEEHSINEWTLADGYAFITEAGVRALETDTAVRPPQRDAQEAWVEVARLRRRLQIAERSPQTLIADEELRRRCEDLLAADQHYDRVIREACVILENRVRTAIGADATVIGTGLMEQAFSPRTPRLRLSQNEQEQRGAMELYRGVMAFFRNAAGHHVIETYSQDEALRFVAWIDLLLSMMTKAQAPTPPPT
ncbi:hypothetical protein SE17_09810 [Kouleothrix aurantiaca]|uniref:Conserved hypothetical protein CHP02391 domain-containing protein n=1 Tax=Kouleothrix aurantiaca TaxID=186479 RepID=A0A0P9DTB4_9CHLR|nr:hypothetical protein SE17_09810 [Kouleothrix aurantiaca]